jgi:hypothetical protein
MDPASGWRLHVTKLLSAAALALLIAAQPAAAADVTADAGYLLTLGGIDIAPADVKLTDAAGRFDLKLDAEVTGLGGMVASGTARIETTGASSGTALAPQNFDLLTRANGEDFSVNVQYAGGGAVTAFVVKPPLLDDINRVPIERSQLSGVGDMLSAFVLRGDRLDASLCQRRLRIFTGVERFDLALSFLADDKATSLRTAYQGPVIQCRIKYTPISGHFTTSDTTNFLAKSDQLFIWYAPLGTTGYFLPYRALIATSAGDLSMVLTKLAD